jgi:hypothetical protein
VFLDICFTQIHTKDNTHNNSQKTKKH